MPGYAARTLARVIASMGPGPPDPAAGERGAMPVASDEDDVG